MILARHIVCLGRIMVMNGLFYSLFNIDTSSREVNDLLVPNRMELGKNNIDLKAFVLKEVFFAEQNM